MKKLLLIVSVLLSASAISTLHAQTPASPMPAFSSEIKHDESSKFEYLISGLATTTDAADLVTLFRNRPEIVDAVADPVNHKITVYTPQWMPETDVLEVLKYAGKTVIKTTKELSKFY